MDMDKELAINQVVLSIFDKEYYNESILQTVKTLKNSSLCYISLNKTANTLQTAFKLHNIPVGNIFFIDAVSQGIGNAKERDNVLYVSSPGALTELSIAISESMKSNAFDIVLFDSLSTLTIYGNNTNAAIRFMAHIIPAVRNSKKKGIFVCLEEDINTTLIQRSFMYVDKSLQFFRNYNSSKKKVTKTCAVLLLAAAFFSLPFFMGGSTGGFQGTGFFVAAIESVSYFGFLSFLLIGLFILLIYKKIRLMSLTETQLKAIKPKKYDKNKLIRQVKQKIKKWRKK